MIVELAFVFYFMYFVFLCWYAIDRDNGML